MTHKQNPTNRTKIITKAKHSSICVMYGRQSGFNVTADGVTVRGILENGASFTRDEFRLLAKQIVEQLDATEPLGHSELCRCEILKHIGLEGPYRCCDCGFTFKRSI